jgi:hypothetical protein
MYRVNPLIKGLFILVVCMQSLCAETENWTLLNKINDNSALFYDSERIRVIHTPEKRVWAWILLKNQQDEAQSKALVFFDCALESATMVNEFEYNKQGEVVYSWTESVDLDLVDGKIPRFFCSRYP